MNYFKRFQAFIAPVLVAGLSASMLFSCAKIESEQIVCNHDSVSSAQQSFAAILSEAVSETPSLRSFIRETALEQFDKDYDVFYPYVKNTVVENNLTFRDLLLRHTDEQTLSSIEQALPKLTILVPDWSWMGCFSINTWDPAEDVAVTFAIPDGYIGAYEKGEYLGELPSGSFPDFPVLVIKENERMICKTGTKGSDLQYDFIDAAFNNVQTKVTPQYWQQTINETPDTSKFVPESQINYRAKQAFDYFHDGEQRIYQRDYLYYNMTAPNQTKPRYSNIKETIYKFKFRKFECSYFFDDVVRGHAYDFDKEGFKGSSYEWKNNKELPTAEMISKELYCEGNLELKYLISMPEKNGVFNTEKPAPVSFGDVFVLERADVKFEHKTAFHRNKYTYTPDFTSIKPKWYVVDVDLPIWDLSGSSSRITISVIEFDETGDAEFYYNVTHTNSTNWETKEENGIGGEIGIGGGKISVTRKVGLGLTIRNEDVTNETEKYKRTQGGVDNLGQAELDYLTPVLKSRTCKDGVWGYEVETISTGLVDIMMLPKSY